MEIAEVWHRPQDRVKYQSNGYLARHPGIADALRTGKIEGVSFYISDEPVRVGDTYIAERNTGLALLTCREVNHDLGFIIPTEIAYCYDISECIKIRLDI